jgi:hypothetical protein
LYLISLPSNRYSSDFPYCKDSSTKTQALLCTQLCPQQTLQCLPHCRSLISIYWMNGFLTPPYFPLARIRVLELQDIWNFDFCPWSQLVATPHIAWKIHIPFPWCPVLLPKPNIQTKSLDSLSLALSNPGPAVPPPFPGPSFSFSHTWD